ncbi:hypothetical protein XELAEV_18022312mg [Xenopus laevis]|uniref:Uncharacterized protein n=1 Tax=Xenopus laevis TaxID=8355 RepID=A0A974D4H7_XENLA|nr:hypothetical protein XELAEV_18022312mg [Xenopus laevis]
MSVFLKIKYNLQLLHPTSSYAFLFSSCLIPFHGNDETAAGMPVKRRFYNVSKERREKEAEKERTTGAYLLGTEFASSLINILNLNIGFISILLFEILCETPVLFSSAVFIIYCPLE